jgi:hypothetical protein
LRPVNAALVPALKSLESGERRASAPERDRKLIGHLIDFAPRTSPRARKPSRNTVHRLKAFAEHGARTKSLRGVRCRG